ncbi:MAG: rhodanese-like domain-containing protein [Actinomycetota bacterium]|nr:rhodanese-like domain-containing protein [Actinomycetota bacterium]MDQ3351788.1 rhodanese-like domain-containing protein [Actinomycetota bacterium]
MSAARIRLGNQVRAAVVTVVLGIGLVAACGSDESEGEAGTTTATQTTSDGSPTGETGGASGVAAGAESAALALEEDRTVIDVRTPEEFDAGAVAGAERIGLADEDFAERIAELDPATGYVVYCRTGNRSAQAATQMRAIGLDVLDGGGFDDMVDAGWPAT